MSRWTDREIGHLRYILERKRSNSIWEMSQYAHQKIKKRSVNAISHRLRQLIAEQKFNSDEVVVDGEVFPAEIVSGYIIITLEDGTKTPLHHLVWRREFGEIPSGYHVHHRDNNPLNNVPQNLSLMTATDHLLLHSKGTPPETFMLFSYLQDKNLWDDYLTYRHTIIEKVKEIK